jgi:hypothetical protein
LQIADSRFQIEESRFQIANADRNKPISGSHRQSEIVNRKSQIVLPVLSALLLFLLRAPVAVIALD